MTVILGPPLSGKTTQLVDAYGSALQQNIRPEQILCLTFFPANAEAMRLRLKAKAGVARPTVLPLQTFQQHLLQEHAISANLPPRPHEISAPVRLFLIRKAWEKENGPLWQRYGKAPGSVTQVAHVIDWLSQNRRRFDVTVDELGNHEIAQTYRSFIGLCSQQQLLTFQESSLRCLQLLENDAIVSDLAARFPVILVDDLHLARPDQLALVSCLQGSAKQFFATAWISNAGTHAAPELNYVQKTIVDWGEQTTLPSAQVKAVNPAISAATERLTEGYARPPHPIARPIRLAQPFTIEDEMNIVAIGIIRALLEDATLAPSDVVVAAADSALLPFAARVLSQYGLPVVDPTFTARHTPLVQGGLLIVRWLIRPDLDTEIALLSLPYSEVDPLDRSALRLRAVRLNKSIFSLTQTELPARLNGSGTLEQLERFRQQLVTRAGQPLTANLIESAIRDLGALQWAAASPDHPRTMRDTWVRTFATWLDRVREFEIAIDEASLSRVEQAALIDNLSDYAVANEPADSIQLITTTETNGHQARLAFVIGVSENATPVLKSEFQMLTEDALPALFADKRNVISPKTRDRASWLEREARALALLISRGRETLFVSVSRYTSAGNAQLPSPFFERLLGTEGEIDRNGNFIVNPGGLCQLNRIEPDAAESRLPFLDVAPPMPQQNNAVQILDTHLFSASQLKMYLTCPLQFFYGRILGIEPEGAGYFDRGSLLHEVLCATLGDGRLSGVDLRGRSRPAWLDSQLGLFERARTALDAAWLGVATVLPGGGHYRPTIPWHERFGPRLQREAVRRWAEGVILNWTAFEIDGLPDSARRRPVFLEANFTLDLEGYRLVGRIDRIDELHTAAGPVYELIDYKTGSVATGSLPQQVQKFMPATGEQPTDYQLPLYALALMNGIKEFKATPETLRFVNLESLQLRARGGYAAEATRAIRVVPSGAVDIKAGAVPISILTGEIKAGIVNTMTSMSSAPYSPRPDYHCTYCSFRAACDRGQTPAAVS